MVGSVFSLQAGLLHLAISAELHERYYSRKPPAHENSHSLMTKMTWKTRYGCCWNQRSPRCRRWRGFLRTLLRNLPFGGRHSEPAFSPFFSASFPSLQLIPFFLLPETRQQPETHQAILTRGLKANAPTSFLVTNCVPANQIKDSQ